MATVSRGLLASPQAMQGQPLQMELGRFLLTGAGEAASTGKEDSGESEGSGPLLLQDLPTCPHPAAQSPGLPTLTIDTLQGWELSGESG